MTIRRMLALILITSFVLGAAAQHPDIVFPSNDPLRLVVEPIRVGMDDFEAKIATVKAQGREPLGLVLAGGSARAYSYIGMLEVLESEGIRPDFIVANSMGAILGLLYASGMAPSLIAEFVQAVPAERYLDFVLPTKGGLINVDAFEALIGDLAGNLDIAGLPIPIVITAEDLTTRRRVEIASGDLDRVMASSFAMPAIFEPKRFGDTLLVDGGATTLVPIALAARYSSRIIVATALYNKAMDFDNPITVLNRVVDIGKTRTGMEDLLASVPFVIRNDVESFSYMEFASPEAIIQRGRESARKILSELSKWLPVRDSVPNPVLELNRAEYRRSVPPKLDAYRRGALPSVEPSLRLRPQVGLFTPSEPKIAGFDDQGYAGIGIGLALGRVRAFIGGLVGWNASPGKAWGIAADFAANPGDSIRIDAGLRLYGDIGAGFPFLQPESIEARTGLSWRLGTTALNFEPYLSGLLSYDFDSVAGGWESEAGFSLASRAPGSGMDFPGFFSTRTGYFVSGGTGLSMDSGPLASFKAGFSLADTVALRGRVSGRYGMEGTGLGLGRWDSYRGVAPSVSAVLPATSAIELIWLARALEFDAGEILLVESVELGPYVDCVWAFGELPAPPTPAVLPKFLSAGLSLSATLRFAGLNPFELSLYGGYDVSGGYFIGLRSGRLFPAFR